MFVKGTEKEIFLHRIIIRNDDIEKLTKRFSYYNI